MTNLLKQVSEFTKWLEEEDRQNWEIERYVEQLLQSQREEIKREIVEALRTYDEDEKCWKEVKEEDAKFIQNLFSQLHILIN